MPIPDFNHNNVIPPHLGDPTNSNMISPYKADIMEFCNKFAKSKERINILKGFINFRLDCYKWGINIGFQWIDGSFSENIEISEKRAPHDIDVVTFTGGLSEEKQHEIIKHFPAFGYSTQSKPLYYVDHYPVLMDVNPMLTINATKYWIQLFSHNRKGVWKGMIEIPLYDKTDFDNEALAYLNSL